MKHYEAIVIGAGPAGYEAALNIANKGLKTLLIEKTKENIGGTCLNEGCIPAKQYLEASSHISNLSFLKELGVELELKDFDIKQLQQKTKELKDEIRSGVLWLLEQAKVDILYGSGKFIDEKTIEVNGETISFDKVLIATGSKTKELEHIPFDGDKIISSKDIFTLEELPKSITILGSGAIGCEAASFFKGCGSDVTLISKGDRILSKEDEDISKALQRSFKRKGINILLNTNIKSIKKNPNNIEITLDGQADRQIICDKLLICTGRVPNCNHLNIEKANIEKDTKGYIKVNSSFETSKSHIYAVGDCIDTPAFAHTAGMEAKIAAINISKDQTLTNTHLTPSTIFTQPNIASCGIKQKDLKEDEDIQIKKAYFKANSKAKIMGDDLGFVKIFVDKDDKILSASMIGIGVTEMIDQFVLAIEKNITYKEFKNIIRAHPTLSEIISYL
ncbi:MAG: dihydrolipoyl dehydrogenase [Campylobacterota bacterium]|nr:dihydrolipoyl dehydrogenase [Campylobacterota bacterium]